jgi:hypothetical protein
MLKSFIESFSIIKKDMKFNDILIFGGAALALVAGFYIMSKEGFLDDILGKFNLSSFPAQVYYYPNEAIY